MQGAACGCMFSVLCVNGGVYRHIHTYTRTHARTRVNANNQLNKTPHTPTTLKQTAGAAGAATVGVRAGALPLVRRGGRRVLRAAGGPEDQAGPSFVMLSLPCVGG